MLAFRQFVNRINYALYIMSAILLFLIACMIIVDVVGRGVFNSPLTGTFELVSNAIVLVAFLQLCYSIRTGGMFRATIVRDILPIWGQRTVKILGDFLGALLFGLIVYGSWHPMIEAWTPPREFFGGGDFQVPTYHIRSMIAFCSAFACLNYIFRIIEELLFPGSTLVNAPGTSIVDEEIEDLNELEKH